MSEGSTDRIAHATLRQELCKKRISARVMQALAQHGRRNCLRRNALQWTACASTDCPTNAPSG